MLMQIYFTVKYFLEITEEAISSKIQSPFLPLCHFYNNVLSILFKLKSKFNAKTIY